MPPVPLHLGQVVEGKAQPESERSHPDVAQVVGTQRGEQLHADVGRRRPPSHLAQRVFLKMVWSEPVVIGTHELLEVEPRSAGQAAQ